jgi:hypothetical protein
MSNETPSTARTIPPSGAANSRPTSRARTMMGGWDTSLTAVPTRHARESGHPVRRDGAMKYAAQFWLAGLLDCPLSRAMTL